MIKPILAAVAAFVAVPALAAPADYFNGPFVGVQGGWQQDHERAGIDTGSASYSYGDRHSGFAYGAQAGWDVRLTPRTLLGVEASATGRTGSSRFYDSFDDGYRLRDGRTLNATARLGYLVTPLGLLYARGGYSNARFKLDTPIDDIARNRGGYVVGVGYEQALTRAVSARIEYDHSDYGHDRIDGVASGLDINSARLKYDRNAVTAGVNLHF